ncbi:MAG: hypothetical protein CMH61_01825, partial [Nanoarchaeota archaeon]|nr:hypothetical protein [Nanoarchaeota archaeon]
LQDIAVRRVLRRLGRHFEGDHLVQIRGHKSEGYVLNPGQVPFHKPELILPSERKRWWKEGSVEAFYQHNKILVVDSDMLLVTPVIKSANDDVYYQADKKNVYRVSPEEPKLLHWMDGRKARREAHQRKDLSFIRKGPLQPYSSFMQKL